MDFSYRRSYRGPIKAVVLDWAGTTVDYGSVAPAVVFVEAFKHAGVDITMSEARGPMGMSKKDHIRAIMHVPRVISAWTDVHGRAPREEDVERVYAQFTAMQMRVLTEYADLIPGTLDAMSYFRRRGIRVGSCSGYTRAMMDVLVPAAAHLGFQPDAVVAGDEVPAGRPAPWMALENAKQLGVYPMEAIVKIGDTIADMEEGLNAGMWTIGLAKTGNVMGLSPAEMEVMADAEVEQRLDSARGVLAGAGAHYVVDGIGDVAPIIEEIERRLRMR